MIVGCGTHNNSRRQGLFSTLPAGIVAVFASFAFPLTVKLKGSADISQAPSGVGEVLSNLLTSMVNVR